MRALKLLFYALFAVFTMTALYACSSDEPDPVEKPDSETSKVDKVNPKLIYKAGLPKTINGGVVKLDSKNRISAIGDYTFEYIERPPESTEADVIVKDDNEVEYEIWLNDDGLAERIVHENMADFSMKYDENKALTNIDYVIKDFGETFTTSMRITNSGGNVFRFFEESEDSRSVCDFSYLNAENLGGYPVVVTGDLSVIFFTGMLGKTSAYLPTKAEIDYVDNLTMERETYEMTYSYKLNPNGLPQSVTRTSLEEEYPDSQTITYTW